MEEVLSHPYFKDYDIEGLCAKKVTPPFIPDFGDTGDFNKKLFNV